MKIVAFRAVGQRLALGLHVYELLVKLHDAPAVGVVLPVAKNSVRACREEGKKHPKKQGGENVR
jgi:hypothetical protein